MKYKYLMISLLVVLSCSWLEAYAGFGGSSGGSRSVSVSRSPSPSYSRPSPSTSTIAISNAGSTVAAAAQQQKAMSLYDSKTATTGMSKPVISTVQPARSTSYTPTSNYTPTGGTASTTSNRTTVINNTTVVHQNSGSGSGLGTGLVVGAVAGALIADSGRHDTVYVQQSAPPVQYTQPAEPVQNNYAPAPISPTVAAEVHSGFSWATLFMVTLALFILAIVVSTAYSKR